MKNLNFLSTLEPTNSVIIDEKFMRNPNLFFHHLFSMHKGKMNWNNIKEIGKKEEMAKNMLESVKRLTCILII